MTPTPRTVAEPFDEADEMCPNCVTPWKCNGPHLPDMTIGATKRRQQAAQAAPPDALREALDLDAMRVAREWPTPNHMRTTADALDLLSPARYGDVLRWFADRCDEWVWHMGDVAASERLAQARAALAALAAGDYERAAAAGISTSNWEAHVRERGRAMHDHPRLYCGQGCPAYGDALAKYPKALAAAYDADGEGAS